LFTKNGKNIAVRATGFKERPSNSTVTEMMRENTPQPTKQQKKPQEKKTHHFSVRHIYPGCGNTAQTFKVIIWHLGNSV